MLSEPFAQAFVAADAGHLAALLLHRAQMEDGLRLLVGRDAIVAELLSLAACGTARGLDEARAIPAAAPATGWTLLALRFGFQAMAVPQPLVAGDAPLPNREGPLDRHLWLRLEAGRVAEIVAVTDWAGLATRLHLPDAAAAHAAAHPALPPLGELASGRGQLAAPDPFASPAFSPAGRFVAMLNARRLAALPAEARERWLKLFAQVPDARVTLDQALGEGGTTALLWRLQGHITAPDGTLRRVSLPGSTLLTLEGDLITTEETLFDMLALEATRHRPLWPD